MNRLLISRGAKSVAKHALSAFGSYYDTPSKPEEILSFIANDLP